MTKEQCKTCEHMELYNRTVKTKLGTWKYTCMNCTICDDGFIQLSSTHKNEECEDFKKRSIRILTTKKFELRYSISFESESATETERLLDSLTKMGITILDCLDINYVETDDDSE